MFKNLGIRALGTSGRQSELIELTLTHGFKGFDLDMGDFLKRIELYGEEHARRFIDSARITIGDFPLPIDVFGSEAAFKGGLARLDQIADVAARMGAQRCHVMAQAAHDELNFAQIFDTHVKRLSALGQALAAKNLLVGVGFHATPGARKERRHPGVQKAEQMLKLLESVKAKNVGLLLDTFDWVVGGGGLDQLRELPGEKIVSVRLADAPDNIELGKLEQENRLLPGESNVVDNVGVLKWLDQAKYTGPITPYPHPKRFAGKTRENILLATAAKLDEVWAAAGLTPPPRPFALVSQFSGGLMDLGDVDLDLNPGLDR